MSLGGSAFKGQGFLFSGRGRRNGLIEALVGAVTAIWTLGRESMSFPRETETNEHSRYDNEERPKTKFI